MNGSGPTDSVNAAAPKEWLPWDMGIWILFWQGYYVVIATDSAGKAG